MSKKNSLILIISVSALAACGKAPEKDLGEFASYVERFEQKSDEVGTPVRVHELKMRFGAVSNPSENGVCEMAEGETPIITINPKAWAMLDETSREALIFHELGHCVLRRKHDNKLNPDGSPVSLMYAYRFQSEVYSERHVEYTQELFQRGAEF